MRLELQRAFLISACVFLQTLKSNAKKVFLRIVAGCGLAAQLNRLCYKRATCVSPKKTIPDTDNNGMSVSV